MKASDARMLWLLDFTGFTAVAFGLFLLHPGLWCIAAGLFLFNAAKQKRLSLRRNGGRP